MIKDVLAWLDYISSCLGVVSRCLRQALEEWPKLPGENSQSA
jgi:hypothetical protein